MDEAVFYQQPGMLDRGNIGHVLTIEPFCRAYLAKLPDVCNEESHVSPKIG
jgi:hypothetical protein